jgi:hypothetical protein
MGIIAYPPPIVKAPILAKQLKISRYLFIVQILLERKISEKMGAQQKWAKKSLKFFSLNINELKFFLKIFLKNIWMVKKSYISLQPV